MPAPGQMVNLSPAFNPPALKGIKVYSDDPFRFDFVLDPGDAKRPGSELKNESSKLIRYFLASLTIPESDLWVNLSPYEKDRIIPEAFGQTDMGRDLLSQDYVLKQLTSSLLYPEGEIGKKFWAKVYRAAFDKYGTTDIPLDTFNKVWIVPEKATVYENKDQAFVVDSKLKVMLETDYLATSNNAMPTPQLLNVKAPQGSNRSPNVSQPLNMKATEGANLLPNGHNDGMTKDILRSVVIPILEKEVNEGANFALLRQVYQSLILAAWYKKKITASLLAQVYVDKKKVAGLEKQGRSSDFSPEQIWSRYVESFKQGVYNDIKEEPDPLTGELIPRKYFSGGFDMAMNTHLEIVSRIPSGLLESSRALLQRLNVRLQDIVPTGRVQSLHKFWEGQGEHAIAGIAELAVKRATMSSSVMPDVWTKMRYNRTLRMLIGKEWDDLDAGTKLVIRTIGVRKAVQLAENARKGAQALFLVGWPRVRRMFRTNAEFKEYLPDFLFLAQEAGPAGGYLLGYGVPEVHSYFHTVEEFRAISGDLVDMAKAAGQQASHLFKYGFPKLKSLFGDQAGLREHWAELVGMVSVAGEVSAYLFDQELPALRGYCQTQEEFNDYLKELLAMSELAGSNIVYLLAGARDALRMDDDMLAVLPRYVQSMNALLSLLEEEHYQFFLGLSDRRAIADRVMDGVAVNDRYELALFLSEFSLSAQEKDRIVSWLLGPYVFSDPYVLTIDKLIAIMEAYQEQPSIKYFLYYVANSDRVTQDVKNERLNAAGMFPLHQVADHLKTGRRQVLIVHNINDGMGDELIRTGSFMQGLLDLSPGIQITIVTKRPFLYSHPRVKAVPIKEALSTSGRTELFDTSYDVVVDHYLDGTADDPDVEYVLRTYNTGKEPHLYLQNHGKAARFNFDKVVVAGKEYSDELGLAEYHPDNAYESMLRLLAELGMPLNIAGGVDQRESALTALQYAPAEDRWRAMMRDLGNNKNADGQYGHPVALLNLFGGMFEEKGFGSHSTDMQASRALIIDLVTDGYKVVLVPNGEHWGTQERVRKILEVLPAEVRRDCVIADEPAADPWAFKYYVEYADKIVTVEGGMMHLAFNMGKPLALVIRPGSGTPLWWPYGLKVRTGVREFGEQMFYSGKVWQNDIADHVQKMVDRSRPGVWEGQAPGGIDLDPSQLDLSVQTSDGSGLRYAIDPKALEKYRSAPGFVPVVTGITSLNSLPQFLGIAASN